MTDLILNRANTLKKQIRELENSLYCFEEEWNGKTFSKNPTIIIEYDNDGRETHPIPMVLNTELITLLKTEIVKSLETAKLEFNNL